MTQEEKDLLQATMDQAHRQFIRDVAQGRNMPEEKVREIADGRIIMGETAQKLGLVDELGNFEDAVKASAKSWARSKANRICSMPKKETLAPRLPPGKRSQRANRWLSRAGL